MPYKTISEAPGNWQTIDGVKLTLAQINHIASIYDSLVADNYSKESASKIALTQFRKLYKKEGDSWVKLESEPQGLQLIFNGSEDNPEKIELGVYQKEILRTGDYAHPQFPKQRFVVTAERIKKWIQNFKGKILDFVPVPISSENGHRNANDPRLNKGEVLDIWAKDNEDGSVSLMGKIKLDDEASKLIDEKKLRGVSASISQNYLDKQGKNVGDVFTHLLLTNIPYLTGTTPFQPILNSKEEIIGSMINLSREIVAPVSLAWEETEDYIRSGHQDPDKYSTCRTTDFDGKLPNGIKAVYCKVKDSDKWEIQSYLFPKEKFTMDSARKWFSDHGAEFENIGSEINLSVVTYEQYPIMEGIWDRWEAIDRIRKWASSDGSGDSNKVNLNKYMKGFAYVDSQDKDSFRSFKLAHHDIDDGNIKTYHRGIIDASNELAGFPGDIPESDLEAVKDHINKHRKEFELEPLQFDGSERERKTIKLEIEKYGAGNPKGKGNKKESEVEEMEKHELEVQLDKIKKEKADLEQKTADMEAKEKQLAQEKTDLEAKNKKLSDIQLEANKKADEAQVEAWLTDGKITEAHKAGLLVLLESGRDTAIELEVDGKKETQTSHSLLVDFVTGLPKAIDYEVKGHKSDGKPSSEEASLEAEGEKAGKRVRGEEDKDNK